MRKVFLKILMIACFSLFCACTSSENTSPNSDLTGSVPEPFALRAKAEKRLSEDYQRDPQIYEINSEAEFNKIVKKYEIKYESQKVNYNFNKSFFKKNKLYVVMKDGDSISVKCEMKSFKVEGNSLNIVFEYTSRPVAQDFLTLGFIVATDRERVKAVKKVSANYETLKK